MQQEQKKKGLYMVVVTLDLWKRGRQTNKENKGKITITNNCTGTEELGNYNIKIFEREDDESPYFTGKVTAFPRKKEAAVKLLYLALKERFNKEQ